MRRTTRGKASTSAAHNAAQQAAAAQQGFFAHKAAAQQGGGNAEPSLDSGKSSGAPLYSGDDIFTPEVVTECKELFAMFDGDGGGSIDRDEFGQMMRTLGLNLNDRELDEFFAEMDEDGGGSVEFDEMLDMLKKISQHSTPELEFKEAFKFFDLDNSGEITCKELMRVVNTMGGDITLDMAEEMICNATGSDEGVVDLEGFKQFCKGGLPADTPNEKHLKGDLTRTRAYSALLREMGGGVARPPEMSGQFSTLPSLVKN